MAPSVSASLTNPSLSYADRAKKAQNIRSPKTMHNAPTSHPSLPGTATVPHGIASHSVASSTSKPNINPTNVENVSSLPDSPSETKPSSPPTSKDTTEEPEGSQTMGIMLPSQIPSQTSSQKPTSVVNVWNLRKEQMVIAAQAGAQAQTQHRSTQSSSLTHQLAQRQTVEDIPSSQQVSDSGIGGTNVPNPPRKQRQNNHRSPVSTNGASSVATDEVDDPFVVRIPPRLQQKATPPGPISLPSTDDREVWPEVGKSVSSTAGQSHHSTPGIEKGPDFKHDGENSKDADRVHDDDAVPRKSEKPNWVRIPPEELQATADSMRSGNRHNRGHSQPAQHSGKNQASTSGSGSRHISRVQSRNHSDHNSVSHSASQSRGQSRVASLQSSPRLSAQGRRLPEDEIGRQIGYGTDVPNQTHKSGSSTPYINIDPSTYGAVYGVHPALRPPVENGAIYYPTPPPLSIQPISHPPYTYSPNSMHGLYSLPIPSGYPGHSPGSHSPSDVARSGYTGAGTPPYAMYPQYSPYGYGQPYIPWNDPHALPLEHHTRYIQPHHLPSEIPRYDNAKAAPQPPIESPTSSKEISQYILSPGDANSGQRPVEGVEEQGNPLPGEPRSVRGVIFGSIGLSDDSGEDAVAVPSFEEKELLSEKDTLQAVNANESTFAFSIGVAPGDIALPRSRNHKRMTKNRLESGVAGGPANNSMSGHSKELPKHVHGSDSPWDHADHAKAAELSPMEAKWKFGSIGSCGNDEAGFISPRQPEPGESLSATAVPQIDEPGEFLDGKNVNIIAEAEASMTEDLPQIAGIKLNDMSGIPSRSGTGTVDEWQVRDFGFGFGSTGNGSDIPLSNQQERTRKDWDRGRGRDNNTRDHDWGGDRTYGRPRRGSLGVSGYERGRRGRGVGGRGANSRGYGHGGYQSQHQRPNSFPLVPPPQFNAIPVTQEHYGAYLHGGQVNYIPPYDYQMHPPVAPQPGPPIPAPLSALAFPFDATRNYLLGQLEYYLSPQNMAQDLYLRQRMDNRGWISIALLAEFKRVKQVTDDMQLVKDLLSLSSWAEVKGDWVRMSEQMWKPYVLPRAPQSIAEPPFDDTDQLVTQFHAPAVELPEEQVQQAEYEAEEFDIEEEEEEEVEFVIGPEASSSWTEWHQPTT